MKLNPESDYLGYDLNRYRLVEDYSIRYEMHTIGCALYRKPAVTERTLQFRRKVRRPIDPDVLVPSEANMASEGRFVLRHTSRYKRIELSVYKLVLKSPPSRQRVSEHESPAHGAGAVLYST